MMNVFRLMLYKDTRNAILNNAEVVLEIIEQLGNTNTNVRKQAEQVLDIVQYYGTQWSNTIKLKKYQVHNQAFLQVLEEYERLAANAENAQELGEDEENPNEIQWYDSNEIGARKWSNTGAELEY